MSLKLFRTTEYSSSSLFSHTRPQAGVWPSTLVLAFGLWVAVFGNVALWRAAFHGTSDGGVVRVSLLFLVLGLGVAAFSCAVLSLLAWRTLLKPAISAMLMLCMLGTYSLLGEAGTSDSLAPWPQAHRLVLVLLIGLLPMLWLWRQPVRVVSNARRARGNLAILAASLALLAVLLSLAGQDLASLVRHEPGWACMIDPAAPVLRALGQCVAV